MTPTRLRRLSAAAALLTLAGCAGLGGGADLPLRDDGDRLMEIGDFGRAVKAYRRDLAQSPDDESLRLKLANARSRAATRYADLAILAATGGDATEARRWLQLAQDMDPELPYVIGTARDLGPMIAGAARAAELKELARGALRLNPIRAESWLIESRTHNPNDPEAVTMLAEATLRAEAERAYLRAAERWDAGRRSAAVAALRHARYDNAPTRRARRLWRRIETSLVEDAVRANEAEARLLWRLGLQADLSRSAVRTLRAALVDRLSERAAELRNAGRPAVAALVEIEMQRVGGRIGTPALEQAREGAAVDVVVAAFANDTEHREPGGDAVRRALARRLREDVGAGGALLRIVEGAVGAGTRDVRLIGSIHKVAVVDAAPVRSTKLVSFQSGTRPETDAEKSARTREYGEFRKAMAVALAEQTEAHAALEALVASHERRLNNLRFDAYSKRRLNQTVSRARNADAVVHRLREQAEKLLTADGATRSARVPVYADHELQVTRRARTAVIGGEMALLRGDRELLRKSLTASVRHEETIAPAFSPAGLAEDPDESPDDDAMTGLALERFAELVSAEVRHASEELGRGFLEAARTDEAAGRVHDAAEGYALYLLCTPEVLSDARAEAAKAVRELAQVHVVVRTGAGNEPR